MKVGLVGVGRWGRTLARAFERSGAEIAAHDRATDFPMPDRFGPRIPWQEMIDRHRVDAIVAATPSDVTPQIFLACQEARMPSLLTKPLQVDHDTKITATTYVDYVHLFSPLWKLISDKMLFASFKNIDVTSTGPGPMRQFPMSIDYAPHAVALLLDAGFSGEGDPRVISSKLTKVEEGETLWTELRAGKTKATITAGHGPRVTSLHAELSDGSSLSYLERDRKAYASINGKQVATDLEHDPLKMLVQSFLVDVATENIDEQFLDTVAVMSLLEKAREKAAR
jgi:hypothetical protein